MTIFKSNILKMVLNKMKKPVNFPDQCTSDQNHENEAEKVAYPIGKIHKKNGTNQQLTKIRLIIMLAINDRIANCPKINIIT